MVLSNGDLVEWKEIIDLLRPINIANCNNLFVTLGVCNGRYLYKGVNSYEKSPYSGYISASKSVSSKEIYENFSELFIDLIENGNIVKSYLKLDKKGTNFYYKDSKTTFEDSFNSIIERFNNDADFKKRYLRSCVNQMEKETGNRLNERESELIMKKVLIDLYDKQKKSFEFQNCE